MQLRQLAGRGLAWLADGRLAKGDTAAARRLAAALAIFRRVGAAFEVGPTHLVFGELSHRCGEHVAAERQRIRTLATAWGRAGGSAGEGYMPRACP